MPLSLLSLMKADKMPSQDELQSAFGSVFSDVLEYLNNNLSNTANLLRAGKIYEMGDGFVNHAAVCFALAAQQKNIKACANLIVLWRKNKKNELNPSKLLSELSFEDIILKKEALQDEQKAFWALIKKKMDLLSKIEMLEYQQLEVLNQLYIQVEQFDVSVENANPLLDTFQNQLSSFLPQYQRFLIQHMEACLKKLEQYDDADETRVQRLSNRIDETKKVEPSLSTEAIGLFRKDFHYANTSLLKIKLMLQKNIEDTLKALGDIKAKPSGVIGAALKNTPSAPMSSKINAAIATLRVLGQKIQFVETTNTDFSHLMNVYSGELNSVFDELDRAQAKGCHALKDIVDQYYGRDKSPTYRFA